MHEQGASQVLHALHEAVLIKPIMHPGSHLIKKQSTDFHQYPFAASDVKYFWMSNGSLNS